VGAGKGKDSRSNTGALFNVIVALILGVGTFFLSLNYFTYKRSTVKTVVAAGLSDTHLLVYSASGSSGLTQLPLASRITVLDEDGKKINATELELEAGSEKVVKVTIRPDGKVMKIQKVSTDFCIEGEVRDAQGTKLVLGNKEYLLNGTIFLEKGKPLTNSASGMWEAVNRGDLVRIYGYEDKVLLLNHIKKAGVVSVTSNVEEAKVFVDGIYKGRVPCTFKTSPGLKEILLKKDGYRDARTSIQVEPSKRTRIDIKLVPVTGTLSVTSDPSGANVSIDDELKGQTPLRIDLPPKEYEVSLTLEGYYPKKTKVRVLSDREQSVNFALIEKVERDGRLSSHDSYLPGEKVTVLRNWPALGVLEVKDTSGDLLRLAVSNEVPLQRLPFGFVAWEKILPGEEIVIEIGTDGKIEKATRTYTHTFVTHGKIMARDGDKVFVGDRWVECLLKEDTLVHYGSKDLSPDKLSTGDTVTLYGSSPSDIRFVDLQKTLGQKASFEGFLVKTSTGLRIFNDYTMTWFTVPEDLDVADPANKERTICGDVPSGSRLKFYINPVGDVVWAEYVWRADVSLEGRVGLLSGASLYLLPSWEEVFISDQTALFFGEERKPYYDVKMGDLVQVAGPSSEDIRFVWVKDRLSYNRIARGFIGSERIRGGKVFFELPSSGSGEPCPRIIKAEISFSYPAKRKSLSFREVNWGDQVRIFFGDGGQVVWGEVLERNEIQLSGHFLGMSDGFYYFTGFKKFIPSKDVTIIGLEKEEQLTKGSKVYVGGKGEFIDYLEVEKPVRPERWVVGTILSVSSNRIKLLVGMVPQAFELSRDAWFFDWKQKEDGNPTELFLGDRVSVAVGENQDVLCVERSYSPVFKFEGTVTKAEGRNVTISGKTGTKMVTVTTDAVVYRNGEKVGSWSIQQGDKVKVSGTREGTANMVISGATPP